MPLFSLALAACGGGGASNAALPATPPAVSAAASAASVPVSIALGVHDGAGATTRTTQSLAPGARSGKITATNANGASVSTIVNCLCVANLSVPPGAVTFSGLVYDGPDATGNVLDAAVLQADVANGRANVIALAFRPVVAQAVVTVAGGPFATGAPGTLTLSLAAKDAAGNAIGGTDDYAAPVRLALSDTTGVLALSAPAFTTPGTSVSVRYSGAAVANATVTPSIAGTTGAAVALPVGAHPTSLPVASGPVRSRALTFEYAYASPQQYDASYGFRNWSYVKPYVDVVVAPAGTVDAAVRAGGLSTFDYVDPNLCSGNYAVGANPYAAPDCAALPDSAFYARNGNVLTTSYDGRIQQRIGDPASPALQAAVVASIDAHLAAGNFDGVQVDDATTPAEFASYLPFCFGLGSLGGGSVSCGTAAGGAANGSFGSTYSYGAWQAGEAQLAARSPRPMLFNGLAGNTGAESTPAIAQVAATASNVWGAMCETCFYGVPGNTWLTTGTILNARLAGVMQVIGAGRNVVVDNDVTQDIGSRSIGLAETALVYDPAHLYEAGSCGAHSHIAVCPEAALTFYAPYKPYPRTVSDLAAAGGTYLREFGACYVGGSPIGPCASVVNPDHAASHPMPPLKNAYAHTITIAGNALCNCFGDSGAVGTNGPAAPAVVPASGAYVLVR